MKIQFPKSKLTYCTLFILLMTLPRCGGVTNGGDTGGEDGLGSVPADQMTRFRITNQCSYDIWIQQLNMPAGVPAIQRLAMGDNLDFDIPAAGLASTRFWPKKDCDANGNNCAMGQSSPPCPTDGGCAPPVESKIEVTWGCTLSDQSQCTITPQGDPIGNTFYNATLVDGYTFPFTISVESDGGGDCVDLNCSTLDLNQCPTDEDLSQGRTMTHPEFAHENLLVINPNGGGTSGCFSPCKKLDFPGWGGDSLQNEQGDVELPYCCPTPPISAHECRGGPVPNTQYVQAIHNMCGLGGGVYGYSYDDGVGLHNCSPEIKIHMVFGPDCP